MIKLKDIDRALADILLENVLNHKGKPTYTEVAKELSKRLSKDINPHYSLANPLGNVSSLCFELGLPLLSARVVYKNTTDMKVIGDGFKSLASTYRPEYKNMDSVEVWKNELRLIRECSHWHRLREYLDCVSIDVILSRETISTTTEDTLDTSCNIEGRPIQSMPQSNASEPIFPDEVDTFTEIQEGCVKVVTVNVHERNPAARQKCIDYYGTICAVCGIDLGNIYGVEFSGKIHVHHLKPISEYDEEHIIEPINDLRPVCPNCHMVIHCRKDKPYSIEEVKALRIS
jgi:hypothetical protein